MATVRGTGGRASAVVVLSALAPFALGYFLSQLFRAVNAVVGPNLVRDVGLSAAELGLLTAAYLLAFAAFQLPLGVLLDRYGPRRVQTGLLAAAATGSLSFSLADGIVGLTLARALIGLGFAGGLMAGFKAVVIWVPEPRRALANACVMSFGALGILVATVPTELAVQAFGWRMVFVGLALITLTVAALILLVVPEKPVPPAAGGLRSQIAAVGRIYQDGAFWRLAPLLSTTAGAHIGIQTLWAGPWFRDVAGYDRIGVASWLMILAVWFWIGILVSGWVADRLIRRGVDILTVMLGFLAIYLAAFFMMVMQWTSLNWLMWPLFGMSGQVAVLAYPWLASYFGAALAGRAHTAVNLLLFSTAFGVQYLIGEIIDFFSSPGAETYDPLGYQVGFGIILALQLLSLVWFLAGRDRMRLPASADAA